MKKYLFLLFLFLFYIYLKINIPKTQTTFFEYDREYINYYKLKFENGINSYNLRNLLDNYDKEFLIYKINSTEVKCSFFNDCIKDYLKQSSNEFEILNIASGFRINEIILLAYNEIEDYFNKNNIYYEIVEKTY